MAAVIAAALTGGIACGSSSGTSKDEPSGWSPDLPLSLEWNLGQADARYQAVGHGAGYHLYLDGAGATVAFGRGTQVTMKLSGAGRPSALEALDVLPGKVNYFLGARPERWITDVPTFRRARYRGVYPGIDVVYYGQGGNMEHDFVVHPGADPARIGLEFQGASHIRLNADGDLVIEAGGGEMIWKAPLLYQDVPLRKRVEGRYRIEAGGRVGFEVGAYDVRRTLVIDPVILYATNVGRAGSEAGFRVAVDRSGNSYLTGSTGDANYRISADAPQTPPNTSETGDVAVTKLNADGTAVVFTTRLGGLDYDVGLGVAVDSGGNMYVTGITRSRDYPTTPGSFRPQVPNQSFNNADRNDCFITKIGSAGNRLVYSTYLGGTSPDLCTAIAVDSAGSAYVTGATTSRDFRSTPGAFQGNLQLGLRTLLVDAFVAKLKADGSGLEYSSYLGGSGDDMGLAIAVDSAGNAHVAGFTDSTNNFPVTAGALQARFGGIGRTLSFGDGDFLPNYTLGLGDGFVAKVNPTGESLLYATYLGGRDNDVAIGIALDARGNAYVCGSTLSTDFPTSAQALQRTYKGAGAETLMPAGDAFAAKLDPAGVMLYSTYLGGSMDDRALAIAADSNGNAWITGNTLSEDFPVTADAAQAKFAGHGEARTRFRTGDAFVTQLDSAGRAISYASYVGGSADDYAAGIVVDAAGSVYLSGGTASQNFPTTRGSAQPGYGGHIETLLPAGDAFVVKIGEAPRVEEPKPAIAAIANLASGIGGSIAPGEIVAIGGTNLGPAAAAAASGVDGSFATQLSDTRVLFGDTPAPILSASATLVTAVVPFGISPGSTAQVVVEYKGSRSAAVSIPVVAAVPGLFTVSSAGRGQVTATNEDGSANSMEKAAPAGSIVTLIGTGAGLTDPVSIDGQVATDDFPPLSQPVTVLFGETPAEEVFFSGGVKGRVAGYFQIQLRIPAGVPEGEIPVTVKIGEAATQSGVTIAIAPAVPSSE